MRRLMLRKLLLLLIILPVLNFIGFSYARLHPRLFSSPLSSTTAITEASYVDYLRGLLQGNFGQVGRISVAEAIAVPFRNSLVLVGVALLVTVVLGILIGLLAISPRSKRLSSGGLFFLSAGSSMPGFIFGGVLLSAMVYQVFFSDATRTFLPISGYGLDEHLILPVLVLALQPTLHLAKVIAGLLENELQKDYIQVARSKGLSWGRLLWSHAIPNMISPMLVTIGESIRLMLGALVIVEAIFIWPGIGRVFLFTVGLRLDARPPGVYFGNPPVLAAIAVLLGALLLLADLITAVLANLADPRLSSEDAATA